MACALRYTKERHHDHMKISGERHKMLTCLLDASHSSIISLTDEFISLVNIVQCCHWIIGFTTQLG